MAKKDSFLITGAAGFVGASLAQRLIGQGERVYVFVKPDTNLWRLEDIKQKLNIFQGDLTDKDFVSRAIKKIRPTVIYHLATHGAYATQDNAERIIATNVLGTWNLLNACAGIEYKVLVNTGSSSEYGFKTSPMKEKDLLEPNSYYAVAKSAQTLLCQYVARSQKKPIVTFRLFSVYGYYEEASRLIPTLISRCLDGKDLEMASPETARDFVFIEDVVEAYFNIEGLRQVPGEVMNIATGLQSKLKDVVGQILRLTGAQVQVKWGRLPARLWDTNIWVADMTKAQRVLGWKAQRSLTEGLAKTIEWFKVNRKRYPEVPTG